METEKKFYGFGPWTRFYKRKSGVTYAGFCYDEILKKDFLVKLFSMAKSSVSYAGFSFIGSGPGPDSYQTFLAENSYAKIFD